jgi:hypothetical protein
VKKGDIIFNHKQTEQLLKNGYVTSRGKAYASGTAYAEANSTFASYTFDGNGKYTKYDVSTHKTVKSTDKAAKSTKEAKDAAEEFEETLDWVEIRLEEINENLDLMNAKLENVVGYANKNNIIDNMIGLNKTKLANLTAGIKKYSDYAAHLLSKVPAQYREAAQDGSIAIEEFTGEADEKTVEAIKNYREWAQKVSDLKIEFEGVVTTISQLAKQRLDNIAEGHENRTSFQDSKKDQLSASNDYMETTYGFESADVYKSMIAENKKTIGIRQKQRNAMQAELDAAVEAGEIKVGSQDWYDAVNSISKVDTEIINLQTDNKNLQDSINQLHWDNFDLLIEKLSVASDDSQTLLDILSGKDMVDKKGNWTKAGITSLGLHAQNMESAEMEASEYSKQIAYLNKNWQKLGYTEEEYLEKLKELKDGQDSAIQSYNSSKDAIVDLNKKRVEAIKDGIQKEIDAYDELIEKKKEELDAEKDLYDFQKNVNGQQKNIADIKRKLAALSGDNSASARAERARLQAELAEAESELADTYYDRSINNQQTALDNERETFTEKKEDEMDAWDKYLENPEKVIKDSIGTVKDNAGTVLKTINSTASEYGLSLSKILTQPWKDGAQAIQSYSKKFGLSPSSTVKALKNIKADHKSNTEHIHDVGEKLTITADANAAKYTKATYKPSPKDTSKPTTTNTNSSSASNKAAPSVGKTVTVKKSATHFSAKSGNAKMASFVPGGSYTVYQVSGDQILIGRNGAYTGWVAKKDLQGYAKGTKSVDKDQWALIDELGEELQFVPGANGRLEYVKKGTSIVPADLTERLTNLAMNPQNVLDQNRPQIAPHNSIINNNMEFKIDASVGELIHVERLEGGDLKEINKVIDKAWDKKMQGLNNAIKKFSR